MTNDLSAKERIERALTGKSIDYVPFSPFLAYVWEHFPKKIQQMGQLDFLKMVGADPLWRGAPCPVKKITPGSLQIKKSRSGDRDIIEYETPVGTLRETFLHSSEGNTHFLVEHALKTPEDFKIQLWIEEHTRYELDLAPVNAHFSGDGREGLSIGILQPRMKTAFQHLVEHLVGTENLVYALVDYPEIVEPLLEKLRENNLKAAKLALDAPYEHYLTWEDSSTQNYSPTQYQQYISPEIRDWCQLLATADKKYIQHACGHVKDLIGFMKADGAFAIESLSPDPTGNISLREARQIAGTNFGIIGGIEPTLFLNLSEDELVPYVEQVLEDGKGGPFVLANADSCPPGVTVEKFKKVAEVTRSRKA